MPLWFSLALLSAILGGILIVYSRMLNAHLGQHIGIFRANLVNHVVGSIAAFLLVIFFLGSDPLLSNEIYAGPWWYYIGGLIGAIMVSISNFVVPRISVISATTLIFIGQGLAGVLLDAFRNHIFSWTHLIGLGFIILGFLEVQRKRNHRERLMRSE
jgi:uncharacterized membrane protein YdcZ (DUF606 family)